jgi:excisionase family DNA binding protein
MHGSRRSPGWRKGYIQKRAPEGPNFPNVIEYTGESILAQIMTTKEMAKYLKLHQITICKLSKEGKIPSVRIGRVWRFDREVVDEWIAKGQNK